MSGAARRQRPAGPPGRLTGAVVRARPPRPGRDLHRRGSVKGGVTRIGGFAQERRSGVSASGGRELGQRKGDSPGELAGVVQRRLERTGPHDQRAAPRRQGASFALSRAQAALSLPAVRSAARAASASSAMAQDRILRPLAAAAFAKSLSQAATKAGAALAGSSQAASRSRLGQAAIAVRTAARSAGASASRSAFAGFAFALSGASFATSRARARLRGVQAEVVAKYLLVVVPTVRSLQTTVVARALAVPATLRAVAGRATAYALKVVSVIRSLKVK